MATHRSASTERPRPHRGADGRRAGSSPAAELASPEVNRVTWPNLFVVGAAKAGTTSLYRYLGEHPDVYMSPMKEPHFFSQIKPDPKVAPFSPSVRDAESYLRLLTSASEKIVGQASTSYLSYPGSRESSRRRVPAQRS